MIFSINPSIKLLLLALSIVLISTKSLLANCEALTPKGGADETSEIKGSLDGKIDGLFAKVAGIKASGNGQIKKIILDTLKEYPSAEDLYIKERLIYLKCSTLFLDGKISDSEQNELNDFMKLMFNFDTSNFQNSNSELDYKIKKEELDNLYREIWFNLFYILDNSQRIHNELDDLKRLSYKYIEQENVKMAQKTSDLINKKIEELELINLSLQLLNSKATYLVNASKLISDKHKI